MARIDESTTPAPIPRVRRRSSTATKVKVEEKSRHRSSRHRHPSSPSAAEGDDGDIYPSRSSLPRTTDLRTPTGERERPHRTKRVVEVSRKASRVGERASSSAEHLRTHRSSRDVTRVGLDRRRSSNAISTLLPSTRDASRQKSPRVVEAPIRRSDTRKSTSKPKDAPRIIRSSSAQETITTTSRPEVRRSKSSTIRRRSSSSKISLTSPRPASVLSERRETASDIHSGRRKSSGMLEAIFTSPSALPKIPEKPERKVECLTCMADDVPVSKSAKLACNHIMCHDCLRRLFNMSITDPQHMPPKCCTQDHIPLKHVDRLFDVRFKVKWNRKYQEYSTKNRIYCVKKGCGEWIKPSHIHRDSSGGVNGGRKYAKCSRCKTKVCCKCNGKWHTSRECPKDEETKKFVEFAKKEGWQRCYSCSAMVELKEGCNHMTCRCTAQFCMICGLKWKTCNCPWFNYDQIDPDRIDPDRLNHMNFVRQYRVPRHAARPAHHVVMRGYDEELAGRRRQERLDEAFAQRLQLLDANDQLNGVGRRHGGAEEMMGRVDMARMAANILGGAYNQAALAADVAMGIGRLRQAGVGQNDRTPGRIRAVRRPSIERQDAAVGAGGDVQPGAANANTLLRRHTSASRTFNAAQARPSERVVPRRARNDYLSEFVQHAPASRLVAAGAAARTPRATPGAAPRVNEARRQSLMAGLARASQHRGGRVGAWLEHVEGGDVNQPAPRADEITVEA